MLRAIDGVRASRMWIHSGAQATPATAVVAPVVTKPEPPSRRRTQNVFSGRRPKAKSEPTPVVFAPVDNPAAGGQAGLPAPTLAEVRQLLAAAIPVSDHQLRALADERARAVRTALLEGGEIDEARLLLTLPAPEPAGARVLLQLR